MDYENTLSYTDAEGNAKTIKFGYKITLDPYEKTALISNVTDTLMTSNLNMIIFDILFDIELVKFYTDINIIDYLPEEGKGEPDYPYLTHVEKFFKASGIVNFLKENVIFNDFTDKLKECIKENVDYRIRTAANGFYSGMYEFLDTLNGLLGGIDTEKIASALETVNGISKEDIQDMALKAISEKITGSDDE